MVRQFCLPGLKLTNFIDGLGKELDHVEPIDCHPGGLELLLDGGKERRGHVSDNFDNVLRTTLMGFDERAELRQAFFALAGSCKDHGLVGPVHVDEDGNIFVAALGGCLIHADRLEAFQVQCDDGFGHIVVKDEPQALVRDLDVTGHGIDRHLTDKAHDDLFEKQGEATAFPGPSGFDTSDSMLRAIDPR